MIYSLNYERDSISVTNGLFFRRASRWKIIKRTSIAADSVPDALYYYLVCRTY